MSTHRSYDCIIVGGGVFGMSIAYHCLRDNPTFRVLVLERREFCEGATSRAAALMTRMRAKENFIPLSLQTYRDVQDLEAVLGESLSLKKVGMLHVAASPASTLELERLTALADEYQEPWQWMAREEAENRCPWIRLRSAQRIAYFPEEAYCDPYLLGSFFARAARRLGAELRPNTEVLDLVSERGQIRGVKTPSGTVDAGQVVLASGVWSPVLARTIGLALPQAPVRSQYWITEKSALFPETSPMVLLPDAQAYLRPEGGALLFGIREKRSMAVSPDRVPADQQPFPFSPDRGMGDLSEVIDRLAQFFPSVYDIGLRHYMAGFCSYTPDNYLTMGKAREVEGLWLATGDVGAGISVCGGVGLAFARMVQGTPCPYNFADFDPYRFGPIDPFSEDWLQQCGAARSQKTSG